MLHFYLETCIHDPIIQLIADLEDNKLNNYFYKVDCFDQIIGLLVQLLVTLL